ncbi:hypothetical protein DFH27DRAFT_533872 [Peziza echinospora]|nr:hypothetical protein DFH27DRAFT_533872 [Peziza echinospora]
MKPLTTSTHRAISRAIATLGPNNAARPAQSTGFPPQHMSGRLLELCPQVANFHLGFSRRFATSSSQRAGASPPPPSRPHHTVQEHPHASFYHLFGRPISKVLLMSVISYQAFYWLWLKLDAIEQQDIKKAELSELEAELERIRPAGKKAE